jgi:hypothetical protein
VALAALDLLARVVAASIQRGQQEEQQGLQGTPGRLQAAYRRCRRADSDKLHPRLGVAA